MELIIKISDKVFSTFKKHGIMTFDNLDEYDKDMIADAIANGTSYNSTGDAISREALKEECANVVKGSNNSDFIVPPTWNKAMELIDNAQAITAERPKGKWVEKEDTPASVYYCCSNCDMESLPVTPYCPWCGAEMEGDEE